MIFYKGRLPWLPASDSKRKPRKGGGVSVIQKDAPTVFSPQRAAASLSLDGQEGERGGQGVSLPSAAKGERFPRGAKGRIRAGNVFPCGRLSHTRQNSLV